MIICAARGLVQRVIRFCFGVPALEGVALWLLHYAIAVFRRVCDDTPIAAVIDGDIHMGLRLTSLLESNLYFLGMDGKDRGEVVLLRRLTKPGMTCLDIGGNVGQIALLLAKRAAPAHVHVFEPSSANHARLLDNIARNRFNNITVTRAAVSNNTDPLTLHIPRTYNTGAVSLYPDASWTSDTEIVPTVRLDEYAAVHALTQVDLIKIDVEGAEMDVLEGADALLKAHRPLVLMEATQTIVERAGRTLEEIFAFWMGRDYRLYQVDRRGGLHAVTRASDLGVDQNLCCVPSERADALIAALS
ncbi:MAG: FkbM family methyltransferase [Chloroflexota bacterium]|nr:FkbM family methyltransferase [Chloroflexota bacterium]